MATSVRTIVELKPLSPEEEAKVAGERRQLRIREALRLQDPKATKTTNASLIVVDTPHGRAAHHRERQGAALQLAKELKGDDKKFARQLARDHAQAKRSAIGGGGDGQKRVPAGNPDGGQWTK
jgi:hypothetical protein